MKIKKTENVLNVSIVFPLVMLPRYRSHLKVIYQLVMDFIVKISEKQKKPYYPLDFDVSKLNRQVRDFLRSLCCT